MSSGDPTGALRLCLEALDRHDAWCGHNPDAPGDGIINRARDAAEAVLRPVSSGVDEWTCPHGTTYAGSADFVRGARIAHQEYERASGDAERIARRFHEAYERLAPDFGYRTREASAVPWKDVPEANRRLMIATVREVLRAAPATEGGGGG